MNKPLIPGDTLLGKYRIERVLGQGGMGVVVAARHLELGELYAIKVMLPHMLDDQDAVERFLREARAAARLKGDHATRVHDVGHAEDGTLLMVMEHLEGTDLKRCLAERGRLPANEAITYVLQACEAIAEAHEIGIVHRDLKPANLFLARKRKSTTPQLKVLDFGIAKEMKPEPGQDLTKTGAMLGSPLYTSPEQMIHSRNVDTRTDIWSLGVAIYELVTGTVPFEGETFTQVVHSVLNLTPKSIREHVPDLSRALDVVILRCLAKSPEMRYPTVDALAEALRDALKAPANNPEDDTENVSTKKERRLPTGLVAALEPTQPAALEPTVKQVHQSSDASADIVLGHDDSGSQARGQSLDTSKRDLPAATTLQSVSPPPMATTTRPRKRNQAVMLGFISTVVICAVGYIVARSSTSVGANTSVDVVQERGTASQPPDTATVRAPAITRATVDTQISSPVISPEASVMLVNSSAQSPSVLASTKASAAAAPITTAKSTTPTNDRSFANANPTITATTNPKASSATTASNSTPWRQGPL